TGHTERMRARVPGKSWASSGEKWSKWSRHQSSLSGDAAPDLGFIPIPPCSSARHRAGDRALRASMVVGEQPTEHTLTHRAHAGSCDLSPGRPSSAHGDGPLRAVVGSLADLLLELWRHVGGRDEGMPLFVQGKELRTDLPASSVTLTDI